MAIHRYKHIEADIDVYKLAADSQAEITDVLSKQAQYGLLSELHITYNSDVGCNEFSFRYKSQTTLSTLTVGNYLVELNDGTYIVKDASTFETEYIDVDCEATQAVIQSVDEAILGLVEKDMTDLGLTSTTELDATAYSKIVEKLSSWKKGNVVTINLVSCGISEPVGLNKLLTAFAGASFVDENTTFTLNFNNNKASTTYPVVSINLFNLIGLQQFIAEFRKVEKEVAAKVTAMTFISEDEDGISAVGTSVSESQWLDWIDDVRAVTGINSNKAISRTTN